MGLTSVPDFYGALPNLRTLDLGHNALLAVPDLSALTRLEILYLHENALTALPKLPIDFGIIHYASDTPYTQARTLGARGLSYYGMDSTYASSVAIMRRILALEGLYDA